MSARSGRADSWYCKPCKNAGERAREAARRGAETFISADDAAASERATALRQPMPPGATRRPPPQAEGYWVTEDAPKSLVIIPDIHIPYHDPDALDGVLEFIADHKPERIAQIGDAFDFYGVSVYPKSPTRVGHTLKGESDAGRPFWEELVRHAREVDYLPGNHEERLVRNVVGSFPALHGLAALDLRSILGIPEAVRIHGYGVKLRVGNITLTHGDKLRRGRFLPKYPAAHALTKYPNMNLVAGHTHIIDQARQVVHYHDGPHHYAMRYIGWLGDAAQIEYESDPSYQQGFAYVEFFTVGGKVRHTFHQIEIVNGQFGFAGKVYGKRRRDRAC